MASITRDNHAALLLREYKQQKIEFDKILNSSANKLREAGTILVGKYVGFDKIRGNVLFWFPSSRPLPRRGEPLFSFVPKVELANPTSWGALTYIGLRKDHLIAAELTPRFWQAKPETKGYHIGFTGAHAKFVEYVTPGRILCFGPQEPPLEYLENLYNLVGGMGAFMSPAVQALLDLQLNTPSWLPDDLAPGPNQALRVLSELAARDAAIIQGPPGTGKTHLTAELCGNLIAQGKRVLVTALTNRALMELLTKPGLASALAAGLVFKAGMSEDEKRAIPNLREGKDIKPQPGTLLLMTYYRMSRLALVASSAPFDTVVVEEASQAYLATIAAAQALSTQLLLVGDPQQLPPIMSVTIPENDAQKLEAARDGLRTVCDYWKTPAGLMLTESFRLPPRAVACTNQFYKGRLKSGAAVPSQFTNAPGLSSIFNSKGGPSLLRMNMPLGELDPSEAITTAARLVKELLQAEPKLDIAVLATYRHTVRALQQAVLAEVGVKEQILVDTVARIQGLTTDVVIYVLVNESRFNQVQAPHFNVATSRARRHTLIMVPNEFPNGWDLGKQVGGYVKEADK